MHPQDLRLELLLRSGTGQTVHCITMSSNFRPYSEIPQDFDCLVWSHVCVYVVDGIGDHVYVYARITFLGTGEEGREMFAEVAFVVSILSFSFALYVLYIFTLMMNYQIEKKLTREKRFFNSSFNIATDIATALLPLPVTKSLNLPKRQRYILMSVFGLGGIICLISIIRFHSLYAIAISDDPSWDNPLAALWAVLEATVGIIASCLPTLKGLVTRYFPNLFSSTIAGSRGGGGGGGGGDVELSRASKSDGGNGNGNGGERVIRIEKWDPKLSETSRSWGKSHKGVRVSEFETDIYTRNPPAPPLTTITASTRDGTVVGRGRTTSDGIQVTKVVEQVERRKEDWSLEDQESLVPVTARERF